MRIMHVALTDQVFPRFHRRWVEGLTAAGHEVAWVSEDWGHGDAVEAAGAHFIPVRMARGLDPVRVWQARRAIRRAIRAFRPHVLVTEQTVPGFLARTAFGKRTYRTVHIVHSWPWHDLTRPAVKRVAASLERLASRRTDHHVVISAEDEATGLREGLLRPGACTQVAVGIDPDRYGALPEASSVAATRRRLGLDGAGPIFLFVGRMVGYKGIFELVEAFRSVRTTLPNSRLVMVGHPDRRKGSLRDHERFLDITAKEREDGSIVHVPFVDDLAPLYGAADVFVMPSIYEGLGLVYVEAGAMGVPSIGYDVRGVREAIDDGRTGLLVPPRDTEALAAAMVRLGKDDSLRAHLAAAGRDRWRERFDNERFAAQMMDIILAS